MSIDIDEIRQKAVNALANTNKPRWNVVRCNYAKENEACGIRALNDESDYMVTHDPSYDECHHMMALEDAEHIAASDPVAVIDIIDRLKTGQTNLDELCSHLSAVLSLIDSKSFIPPEHQRVIMAAREAIERVK